jgi:hypothetical protein
MEIKVVIFRVFQEKGKSSVGHVLHVYYVYLLANVRLTNGAF